MARCTRKRGLFIGGFVVVLIAIVGTLIGVFYDGNDDTDDSTGDETSTRSIPEYPVVTVESGQLLGKRFNVSGSNDTQYAAFLGVPYAKPPIGALRFKGPVAYGSWDGVWNATVEGSACKQGYLGVGGYNMGSEDCLNLNVYTPKLPTNDSNPALPVYFYIHGGGFINGSNSKDTFGPDFFILHDLVVVTTNYRLGAFGYMNLESDKIPGNAAVKDQIFALRWVRDNIAVFGGDPAKVTVGGESAGAASTHWLTLLPEAQGLFRGAIMQSGQALLSWATFPDIVRDTMLIATYLANGSSLDVPEAESVLLEASADEILEAFEEVYLGPREYIGSLFGDVCGPSLQRFDLNFTELPVIMRGSESYVLDPATPPVPLLIGANNDEWLGFLKAYGITDNSTLLEEAIADLQTRTPTAVIPESASTQALLDLHFDNISASYVEEMNTIKEYFFETNDTSCDRLCKFKQYNDEVFMVVDLVRLVRLMAVRPTSAPVYLYRFSVKSDYNNETYTLLSETLHSAIHGDEQHYLWKDSTPNQDYYGDSVASLTLRRMVTLWSNFIKYGNPTPEEDDVLSNITWVPHDRIDTDVYLEINTTLEIKTDDYAGVHWPFWSELYQYYRQNRSF